MRGQRTVIEGQHHLVIPERQGFRILHGADARMLARIDHEGALGADRVGMAGAICGQRILGSQPGEKPEAEDRR